MGILLFRKGKYFRRKLEKSTQGIETSYYLQEKKSIEMPLVPARERGTEQTESFVARRERCGVCLHLLSLLE